MEKNIFIIFVMALMVSCSTKGTFKIPPGTELEIYERPVTPDANGHIEMRPMGWAAAGGAKYKLKKNGEVIKEGKARVKFRVASIFWPPFALIYWPMGLNPDVVNDLTKSGGEPKKSAPEEKQETGQKKKHKKVN